MARKLNEHDAALRELRAFGLRYPGAHTKSPWPGHLDLAVNDKTFAYLGLEGEPFSIACKLPHSAAMALNLPFTAPTPYGLGRSGWVTATPPAGRAIAIELFKAWIDESYRAQAPKRLAALLPPGGGPGPAASAAAAPRPSAAPRGGTRRRSLRRRST